MEDASDDQSPLTTGMPVPTENGVISNDPTVKVNGDTNSEDSDSAPSSGCATPTLTDSENTLKRKLSSPESNVKSCKKLKCDSEFVPPTNPYFNESLFELSGFHHNNPLENVDDEESKTGINGVGNAQDIQDSDTSKSTEVLPKPKRINAKRKKPFIHKFQERPQLLGLQPVIQFKCRKCGQAGFSTLALLKDHLKICSGEPAITNQNNSAKKLFVTRRNVFLCSACGCYYENYNLFLHVYKVHRRFVCLYCSAVFSHTEKFLFHLLSKHNCVPKQMNSEKDFLEAHKDPCYLMCCECEKIFGDEGEEHFFGHVCSSAKLSKDSKNKLNSTVNKVIVNNQKPNSKSKNRSKSFVEHVTGDSEASHVTNTDEAVSESVTETVQEVPEKPLSPVAVETENDDGSVAIEINKDSETNLLGCEDTVDVSNSNEKLDSDEDDLVSDQDIDNNSRSPEHISEEYNVDDNDKAEPTEDVRKVPKVTLKIRHPPSFEDQEHEDSDDSEKLTMELDSNTMDCDINPIEDRKDEKECLNNTEPVMTIADSDIPITELELEQPLDKFDIQELLQKCLRLTIPTCVYCNHARKISVNGKQLGLHAIAEHRFSAVVNSITAEELIPESFVMRIKEGLSELEGVYISLETQTRQEDATFSRVFECFQCRYSTSIHKELYLHNRKLHAKSVLLCIMCKANFYSYSELICHLCPGVYYQENDLAFRCCMCDADVLPSSFRLMVHLRKRHNACDVCLESCHNQSRLSNHVWKHKLHHFCYRCGIAYRNKPDITKHLFWKHGTESVLCKKCLQKKWPQVYHFCVPPSTFTCEECNLNFTKAVALKVHKRLHRNEKPHACTFENCTESFISKKLLLKHEFKHREPAEVLEMDSEHRPEVLEKVDNELSELDFEDKDCESSVNVIKDIPKPKPIVDVLDLPELNLSESDSSDSEDEVKQDMPSAPMSVETTEDSAKNDDNSIEPTEGMSLVNEAAEPVLENIWDNFKNYQAQKEKPNNVIQSFENDATMQDTKVDETKSDDLSTTIDNNNKQKELVFAIMQDHDYSLLSQSYKNDPHSITEQPEIQQDLDIAETSNSVVEQNLIMDERLGMDHSYCSKKEETKDEEILKIVPQSPEKNQQKSINSGSDSDDSSCSCGTNCSCSSTSTSNSDSSDSDSSTSEGRRKQQIRREQRRLRIKIKKESETSHVDVVATDPNVIGLKPVELIIEETDLETTESETDEEFYDKQPQKIANKLMAEKRKKLMLMAEFGPLANGSVAELSRPSTPSLPETEVARIKSKKSKSKKKKRKSKKRDRMNLEAPSAVYQYPTVSPLSISLPKNSPISTPLLMTPPILSTLTVGDFNSDLSNTSDSLRASKRRRIPNKFYGYSSDEEQEKQERIDKLQPTQPPNLKWRKADLPSPVPPPQLLVPPITLKAIPPSTIEEPLPVQPSFHHPHPALFKPKAPSTTEASESASEDEQTIPTMNKPLNQPPLYCYCRCPYDEVSEMIGCDADDCSIEWFHFECVGIMVPPKGQWFCPNCRKKRQQRRELSQL